jgi:hypothetical protein
MFQCGSIVTESFRLALVQILLQQRGIKLNPVSTLYYIGERPALAGPRLLVERCWWSAAGGALLVARCWWSAAGGALLVERCTTLLPSPSHLTPRPPQRPPASCSSPCPSASSSCPR